MSTQFKAIFFDMDGLLIDTEYLSYENTQEMFAPVGIDVSLEWYKRERLEKGTSTSVLLREHGVPDAEIAHIQKKRNERYAQLLTERVVPIEGVVETLQKLDEQYLLGVVTSSMRSNFDIIMQKTGLGRFFAFSITGNDVANTKPDPEPYLKAVERAEKQKEQSLVLEDSGQGVKAAKAAGLTCYAIPNELTKSHGFSIADKVLGSIREVPALLGL